MNKLHIAFVQAGLGAGGAEKVINSLATHWHERGYKVTIFAFSGYANESYFKYPDTIRIETMENLSERPRGGVLRILSRVLWLRERFAELKPDIIISFLTKVNVLALLASRGLSIPIIISERNNPSRQNAHPIWRHACVLLGRYADHIVMQTDSARMALPRPLQNRAIVIPNPCELSSDLANDAKPYQIAAVGRLDPQKGFDLLLQAFSKAVTRIPNATLTIFGDGAERTSLEYQANALGISNKVSMPGTTQIPGAWVQSADIFILSSRFEGFPNVLIEALSAGIATISFNCPWGPADIIDHGKNGLLVPAEDVEALAAAIVSVCSDTNLKNALKSAGPKSAERYAPNRIIEDWDGLLALSRPNPNG